MIIGCIAKGECSYRVMGYVAKIGAEISGIADSYDEKRQLNKGR